MQTRVPLYKRLQTNIMPISELVIGTLRPDVAQEGLSHIRKNQPSIFNALPGSLSNRVGHVIKHNGKDISSEYKPVLALGTSISKHVDSN
jgi:hypothetical protein